MLLQKSPTQMQAREDSQTTDKELLKGKSLLHRPSTSGESCLQPFRRQCAMSLCNLRRNDAMESECKLWQCRMEKKDSEQKKERNLILQKWEKFATELTSAPARHNSRLEMKGEQVYRNGYVQSHLLGQAIDIHGQTLD